MADWAEEVANEVEMEGVAGCERPATPHPSCMVWRDAGAGHADQGQQGDGSRHTQGYQPLPLAPDAGRLRGGLGAGTDLSE